jgi:hypothetical protein
MSGGGGALLPHPNCICVCVCVFQSVDMSVEMSMEAMEIITMSVDKHGATKNYEVST